MPHLCCFDFHIMCESIFSWEKGLKTLSEVVCESKTHDINFIGINMYQFSIKESYCHRPAACVYLPFNAMCIPLPCL